MPTKKELLADMTKADLEKLAKKKKVTTIKSSMRKGEMVNVLAKSRKLKKADL